MSSTDNAPTMALIVREDLNLSAGKTAAQCAHAAVEIALVARRQSKRLFQGWRENGGRKIVLNAQNINALDEIVADLAHGIIWHLVKDAGHTEVPPGTVTVLGLLGPRRSIDRLVGHLETC